VGGLGKSRPKIVPLGTHQLSEALVVPTQFGMKPAKGSTDYMQLFSSSNPADAPDVLSLTPMEGKRVLITGGTTGVGRATARLLAEAGCRVFICGRDRTDLRDAIACSEEGRIGGIDTDVGSTEGIERLFKAADEWLGGLDFAILNAGVASHGALASMSHAECRNVISVNLISYIECSLEAIRRMTGNGGHIVMTGSMSAHVFDENAAVYTAAKAGIRGFANSLRKEANPLRIRVSLIEPGTISSAMVDETAEQQKEMIAQLRMMPPEDVARAIHYMLIQPPTCDIISLQLRPHLQLI